MAERILGMGDMLTLIEKVEQNYDQEVAQKAAEALLDGQFTMETLLEQLQQVKRMGPLQGIIGMIPGVPKELKNADIGEKELGRVEAIIRSMTPAERANPDSINGSRRLRIAAGSGTSVGEVNQLTKQFKEMSKMMKRMPGLGGKKGKGKKGPSKLPNLKQLQAMQAEMEQVNSEWP
jgi:signal recognition particle subunit SRP54